MPTTKQKGLASAMKGVEVGDTVHYVWPDSGHHHAAFVANVLDADRGYVTLSVLDHNGGFMQSPWVEYDAGGAPGTWHAKDAADDADQLDPAGLNVAADGTTPVPTGLTAEVPASRSDEERAQDARVPRTVLKDDPHGHRVADVAKETGSTNRVDRSAITETAAETASARANEGFRPATEPAAHNAANEPSVVRRAEQATPADKAGDKAAAAGTGTPKTNDKP